MTIDDHDHETKTTEKLSICLQAALPISLVNIYLIYDEVLYAYRRCMFSRSLKHYRISSHIFFGLLALKTISNFCCSCLATEECTTLTAVVAMGGVLLSRSSLYSAHTLAWKMENRIGFPLDEQENDCGQLKINCDNAMTLVGTGQISVMMR